MYINCPKCGADRSKRNTRSLSVRVLEGQYVVKCFHANACSWNRATNLSEEEAEELELDKVVEEDVPPVGREVPEDIIPVDDTKSIYYRYYDEVGILKVIIHRVEGPSGKKIFPMRYDGEELVYGMPVGRYLYNTPLLLKYPDLPVLVVEGEKTAEHAQQAFIHARRKVIVTTWPLGCSNILKGNWSLLKGREVTLWPDNDPQGIEAMNRIKEILSYV